MTNPRIRYIVNPVSHGGAGMKAWAAFQAVCKEPIDPAHVSITERAGHARELAQLARGYDILAAVGGDGTVDEVICGIMEQPEPRPKLAIIPCGTGNDIARTATIFTVADAAAALQEGSTHTFDLIRVDGQIEGRDQYRYAFIFGNTGFSCIPMMKPWMKRFLGATRAYYLATLRQIFTYRAPHMRVRVDGEDYNGETYLVVAGNAEWVSGGSMRLSPGALADDGKLNVTIIPSLPLFNIISRLFSSLPTGAHIHEPGVSYITGRKIEIQSDPPAVVDLDGELFGTTPVTFTVCPLALELICAPHMSAITRSAAPRSD